MDISYSEKEVKGKILGLERRGGFPASSPGAEPLRITASGSPPALKLRLPSANLELEMGQVD